jgi:ABC-type long-subunit fatty acid transport system fused permease/ATPase subunit
MKKILVMLCMGLLVAVSAMQAQAIKGGTMYVAVKTIELKSSTGFFASAKGTLAYGATVTVLQINGKWAEVRSAANSSVSGWTTILNLSAKRIVSGATSGATASEVALAGKGFNQEVENAYKAKGSLNYADVDRTEAQKVTKKELQDFITAGRLFQGDR